MILTQCPLILIAPLAFVRCDSSTQELLNFAICYAREYYGENARIVCKEHLFPPDEPGGKGSFEMRRDLFLVCFFPLVRISEFSS